MEGIDDLEITQEKIKLKGYKKKFILNPKGMSNKLQFKNRRLPLKNGKEGKVSELIPLTGGASAETGSLHFRTKKKVSSLFSGRAQGKNRL
ncbi:MAG: hypothetical protein Ct9H300mP20_15410 [Gammaproteobacteria bacterium]|nr:MAG: hypothetical protein Ct9H300mP20_15410 [Gammaproteobacteria bacterium]